MRRSRDRASAGVAAGDKVSADIELGTAPRVVTVPADFKQALTAYKAVSTLREG